MTLLMPEWLILVLACLTATAVSDAIFGTELPSDFIMNIPIEDSCAKKCT
jgi:hypothetical protein